MDRNDSPKMRLEVLLELLPPDDPVVLRMEKLAEQRLCQLSEEVSDDSGFLGRAVA